MFSVGESVLGIQGHPEFTPDVILDLVRVREADKIMPPEACARARATLATFTGEDRSRLILFLKHFLKRPRGDPAALLSEVEGGAILKTPTAV